MNISKDHLIGAGVGAGAALLLTGGIMGVAKLIKKHKEKKLAEQLVALQKNVNAAVVNSATK